MFMVREQWQERMLRMRAAGGSSGEWHHGREDPSSPAGTSSQGPGCGGPCHPPPLRVCVEPPPVPAWQGRALLRAPGFPLELPRGGPAPIPHLLWKLGRSQGGEQGGPSLGSSLVMEGQRHLWAAGPNKHLLGVSVAGGGCPSLATAPVGTSGGGRTGVRSDRCKVRQV